MPATGGNGPLVPHMRPCAWRRRDVWIGDNPPSKRIFFLGLLRVCMALKTLRCCNDSSSSERFEGHTHPQPPPKIISTSSGGCKLFIWSIGTERKASCGALGGHFHRRRPWLWRLWRQLCYVIRLLKFSIKILKLVVCNQCLYVLIYCKAYYHSQRGPSPSCHHLPKMYIDKSTGTKIAKIFSPNFNLTLPNRLKFRSSTSLLFFQTSPKQNEAT
jgi:hypothetical protein